MVRLTLTDIKRIVAETVYDVYKKTPLYEYAAHREYFISRIANLFWQICENYCLVIYAGVIGKTMTREHWRQELKAHLKNISDIDLKKNNDIKKRTSCAMTAIEWVDGDDKEKVLKHLMDKLETENLPIDKTILEEIVNNFCDTIENIATIIAGYNIQPSINDYIEGL